MLALKRRRRACGFPRWVLVAFSPFIRMTIKYSRRFDLPRDVVDEAVVRGSAATLRIFREAHEAEPIAAPALDLVAPDLLQHALPALLAPLDVHGEQQAIIKHQRRRR